MSIVSEDTEQVGRQAPEGSENLPVIETVDIAAVEIENALFVVVYGVEKAVGRDPVGDESGDNGPGAHSDVDIEAAGIETRGEEAVESGQTADLVSGSHDSSPGQHQGRLISRRRHKRLSYFLALALIFGLPSSVTTLNSTSRSPNFSRMVLFCRSRKAAIC